MLPPHELKNKVFNKTMRGYNPVEVDEYIDFLIEKYTELYRENDELERKLRSTMAHLDEIKNDEDSIRSTLLDAKRAANKIKSDAEDRAESIVRSAKASCNTILSDFNRKIEMGRDTLYELQRDAFALKRELFERYSQHIQFIETLTEGMDESAIPESSELQREAVTAIKDSIANMYATPEAEETDVPESEVYADSEDELTIEMPVTATDDSADTLVIDRAPLSAEPKKKGLRDSALALGKMYKENEDDAIINTPDSDVADEESYLDFVKSVTGRESHEKDADLNILFEDTKGKKKK